jgi:arabinose-5-phosphate isomerase
MLSHGDVIAGCDRSDSVRLCVRRGQGDSAKVKSVSDSHNPGANGPAAARRETARMASPAARRRARPGRAGGVADAPALASALRTLDIEREGLAALRAAFGQPLGKAFGEAVAVLAAASGRVIVTGIGKSGHVGQKVAATFASTGTPAFFVHPSEASHGDLGMITRNDAIVALSWNGEAVELRNIVTYSRRFKVPLIAITSRADSTLARQSDVLLELPRAKEACPHGLAPTTSTTMQVAIGDCLAIALLEHKGFTPQDFKVFHPGGSLGASLKFVSDIMHKGEKMPLVPVGKVMSEAILVMTEKSFGCLGVVDRKGRLVGMITDGDLRRHMGAHLLEARVEEIMTRKPSTLSPGMLASAALEQINSLRRGDASRPPGVTQMFVIDKGRPVGLVHVNDFLRVGVA